MRRNSNGPFRSLWVKYGVDPRSDPSLRIYQSVDFRVPRQSWYLLPFRPNVEQKYKRTLKSGIGARNATAADLMELVVDPESKIVSAEDLTNSAAALSQSQTQTQTQTQEDSNREATRREPVDPSFGSFQHRRQVGYQLCDLCVPGLQEFLATAQPRAEFNRVYGWYAPEVLDSVLAMMKGHFYKILGAEPPPHEPKPRVRSRDPTNSAPRPRRPPRRRRGRARMDVDTSEDAHVDVTDQTMDEENEAMPGSASSDSDGELREPPLPRGGIADDAYHRMIAEKEMVRNLLEDETRIGHDVSFLSSMMDSDPYASMPLEVLSCSDGSDGMQSMGSDGELSP